MIRGMGAYVHNSAMRSAIIYLARVLGEEKVRKALGEDPRLVALPLDEATASRLKALASHHLETLAQALIAETSASNDAPSVASATRYLKRRLKDLQPILGEKARRRLWQRLLECLREW